jgi:hypothetical protein
MSRSWKASELAIARLLGGERVPVNGRQRGSVPDVEHPWLAIEVKAWKNLPARVVDAMRQAEASAAWAKRKQAAIKLPIAILHHDRQDHGNDLVVMRLKDFMDRFGT